MGVVTLTLAATLCMQLGFFLWKLSAHAQPRIGSAPVGRVLAALFTDLRWVGGFAATALGWVLFLRATSVGEISVIQPLMSTGDLVLVAMAVVFLHERLGKREVAGLAVTVLGAVGLALGAEEVPGAPFAWTELAAFVAAAAVAGGVLLSGARRHAAKEIPLALTVGLSFGTGAVLTEAWSSVAAPGWRAVLHPLLLGVVAANAVGLVLLQAAFQRGRASVIVPVQLAIGNALAVGGGAWLFSEAMPAARIASVALIVGGAALLQGGVTQRVAALDAGAARSDREQSTP